MPLALILHQGLFFFLRNKLSLLDNLLQVVVFCGATERRVCAQPVPQEAESGLWLLIWQQVV